jgi:hypothetical protein
MPALTLNRGTGWRAPLCSSGTELGLETRNFSQGGIHQAFRLNDIQTGGGTRFQLKLRKVQRFAPRAQVLAGDRDPLLIITNVDIGCRNLRQIGEASHVGGSIGRVEAGERAFLRAAIKTEQVEEPGGIETSAADRGP